MQNKDNIRIQSYGVDAYLKVRDDTAIVVSAPEGTFVNNQMFTDENGNQHKILSVGICCGPNVDRSKSSILVEGEFSSQYIYLKDFE